MQFVCCGVELFVALLQSRVFCSQLLTLRSSGLLAQSPCADDRVTNACHGSDSPRAERILVTLSMS